MLTENFLVTPVTALPTGKEKGKFLSIDVGGTNLRVGFVELIGEPDGGMSGYGMTRHGYMNTLGVGITVVNSLLSLSGSRLRRSFFRSRRPIWWLITSYSHPFLDHHMPISSLVIPTRRSRQEDKIGRASSHLIPLRWHQPDGILSRCRAQAPPPCLKEAKDGGIVGAGVLAGMTDEIV